MEKPTWKNVFNAYNIFPKPFGDCLYTAKSAGYNYMSFNGRVYDVNESLNSGKFVEVCLESDLDKEGL